MKKLVAALVLCVLCSFALNAALAENTTTIMIYLCGSDLETLSDQATADINEMIDAEFDASCTNVVMMLSGSKTTNSWFSEEKTSIWELGRKGAMLLEQNDARNMGDGETLGYFLRYAYERYDSDRYILIFWNHGGGPLRGVCWDEVYSPDNLTMRELTEALANSPFAERKLDMIGFDACLMGSLEVAWMLAPYADYMVASEEMEPGEGWNYGFLRGIEQDASVEDMGRRIVDSYFEGLSETAFHDLTLACVDLRGIPSVVEAMSGFFDSMVNEVVQDTFQKLSMARRMSHDFGRWVRASDSSGYDLVDLRSLMDQHADGSGEKRDSFERALDRAIVYSRSNVEGCSGLSVYFPYYNAAMYRETGESFYENLDFCPGYTAYIQRFGAYLLGEELADWSGIVTETEATDQGELITARLTAQQLENFASAQLVILETDRMPGSINECYRRIYDTVDVTLDGEGRLSSTYHDERIVPAEVYWDDISYYENGISLPYQALDTGEYAVDALASRVYADATGAWEEANAAFEATGSYGDARLVRLVFSRPDSEGFLNLRQILVYDAITGDFTTRAGFRLTDYSFLYFRDAQRYPVRGETGALLAFHQWPTERMTAAGGTNRSTVYSSWRIMSYNDMRLRVVHSRTRSWRYAAFQITDAQNHTYLTEPVALDSGDMTVAEAEITMSPTRAMEIEPYCVIAGGARVELHARVTNRAAVPLLLELEATSVNGRALTDADRPSLPAYIANDGETADLYICFHGFDFGDDARLSSIGFRVRARELDGGVTIDTVDGEMRLDEDISALEGRVVSHVFEPDELTANSPCLWDEGGVRVWLNTAMVTEEGVILAVTCENGTDEAALIYVSEAVLDGERADFLVQENKQTDSVAVRGDVYDAYSVLRKRSDELVIPSGERTRTYLELIRGNGSGISSVSALGFCLNDSAGPHERITITLPQEALLDGGLARWAGHVLQMTAATVAPEHMGNRLNGEVLMPGNAGQYTRGVVVPLTPEQKDQIYSGEAWVGTLIEDGDTVLLNPRWHITYMWFGEDGQVRWAYPGMYLAIGSGEAWEPLYVEEIADGWRIRDEVMYQSGDDYALAVDMLSATLDYVQMQDAAQISFDGKPQDLPEDIRRLYAMHKLYRLEPGDGAIMPGLVRNYPTMANSRLASFFEKSGEDITSYPIRVAMRLFDEEEPIYVAYSFVNQDGTEWSMAPMPLRDWLN